MIANSMIRAKSIWKRVLWENVRFNPLPNGKSLDVSKLKAFADDKIKVDKMRNSFFYRVENTVGKGENVGYQHFLLFPQCFPKPSSLGS